jgi:hypothetical protein
MRSARIIAHGAARAGKQGGSALPHRLNHVNLSAEHPKVGRQPGSPPVSTAARLRNWSWWLLVALWATLSAILYELLAHAIYSAVLDWLEERYREKVAQFLAYASAHLVPMVAAAAICVVVYLLGAFRPRHNHHAPESPAHDAVGPPAAPAVSPAGPAASLAGAKTEQAVCMKADSEFDRIRREAARSPFSAEHQKRIDENIHSDYAPHGALSRSLNIRAETEVIPLIDRLIDSELALRKQYGCPFSQDRIDLLRQRLRGLIAELWEYIVNASCHDAELHVIENTGGLEDYKREELRKRADDLLNKSPSVLIDIVDQKLRAAMADSILSSSPRSSR